MRQEYLLEMTDITKTFPGVKALNNVDLKVRPATVHSLLGENGAGKSTLMKILIGLHKPNSGTVRFSGREVNFSAVIDSIKAGISMIHQELSPVPEMTVAENIFLGKELCLTKNIWTKEKQMIKETEKLLAKLEIDINPRTKMKELSTAYTQLIEIAKAISYDSKLIIMDEPTSAITDKEVEHLFKIINWLKDEGVAIIYISHKMDEIFRISDDITVLRDGNLIDRVSASETDQERLIKMMVGRDMKQLFPKKDTEIREVALEIKNFNSDLFQGVNLKVHKGEILGLAGLMGAGRTEVMESLFGITKRDSGEIYLNSQEIDIKTPEDAVNYKIGFLTEDRKLSGLFLPLSVKDNMAIANIDNYLSAGLVNPGAITKECEEMVDILTIKTPSLEQIINNLSGGNQQKVLLARWLLIDADILILDEPTRGIDVGAKAEIHKLMSRLASEGKAIIMISSELPEVLGMSDRIAVMHEGKITGQLSREEASQEELMKLATGMVS